MDVVTLGMASAAAKRKYAQWAPQRPAGLGWDTTNYDFTATVTDLAGSPRSVATVSISAESAFDAASTARTAPGAQFWVDWVAGVDTNAGTQAAPFKSIWKAIVAGNTAGVPTRINVAANSGSGLAGGSYFRTNNPWYNGGTGVSPSVDIALVATGGRVNTGTFDSVGTPTRDATQTNCYSWAVSSVNRVCDIACHNRFGNYTELVKVGTAAQCNSTPDSWALVSGTVYVNRKDQAAVTNQNTRLYRPATSCLQVRTPVNLYIGGATSVDGFDFEGGSNIGILDVTCATPGTTRHVVAVSNCSFKYGGGYTDTTSKGVAIDSLKGLAIMQNCRADANWSDGFNGHNNYTATGMYLLTINCAAIDNGRTGSVSNNGWTTHEDVIGTDLAGYYEGNRGGTVRCINNSKSWLVGTTVKDDLGDLFANGVMPPTAFQVDNSAEFWTDRCKVLMPAGGNAYVAANSTAKLHRRDCPATGLAVGGAGVVDTF